MAGKNSRSSKTAHVLNLLSGGTPEVKPDAVPPSREAPPPAPLDACSGTEGEGAGAEGAGAEGVGGGVSKTWGEASPSAAEAGDAGGTGEGAAVCSEEASSS